MPEQAGTSIRCVGGNRLTRTEIEGGVELKELSEKTEKVVQWLGGFVILCLVVSAATISIEAALLTGCSAYVVFCVMWRRSPSKVEAPG